jgi:uncharacterized membrane protein
MSDPSAQVRADVDALDTDQLLENLRRAAALAGKDVTIHTNPEVAANGVRRPAHVGLVCVHPESDPAVEYSADTLTDALRAAVAGELSKALRRG